MSDAEVSSHVSEMANLVADVREASLGDSNDREIDALRDALDFALTRWPEIDRAKIWG